MPTLFISHSDSEAAEVLERCLRDSFPGELAVFNTSRMASGLAAGASIDTQVLANLTNASVIIWLASPISVKRSFWMAWELGAASALNKVVIPARCYGLQPSDLPLLQGGKMAPDIGERPGMELLLRSVKEELNLSQNRITETLDSMFTPDRPSALWGLSSEQSISVSMLGKRLLVENRTDNTLKLMKFNVLNEGGEVLVDLLDRLPKLPPDGRRIVEPGVREGELVHQLVQLEWRTGSGARAFAGVRIRGEGS